MKANLCWADVMGLTPKNRVKLIDLMLNILKEEAEATRRAMMSRTK